MEIIKKEMQQEGKCYVYCAEFVGGFCKIGVSNNPKKRLKQVETSNGIPIKDYFLVEGYFKLEKHLHKVFKDKRRYSEWFEIDFKHLKSFLEENHFNFNEEKIENEEFLKKDTESNKTFFVGIYKEIYENYNIWEIESEIESNFNDRISSNSSYIKFLLENNLEIKEEFLKDLMLDIFLYNEFLQNIKIKTGEESDVIKENIAFLCELVKIATFIEFTDTNNMTDKEVYAMVKKHIE